jgi:hypothetical protein
MYKTFTKLSLSDIIYVTKFYDNLREHCGIGYELNNKNIGIMLNDDTQMTKLTGNLQYIIYHKKDYQRNTYEHISINLPPKNLSRNTQIKIKFLWKVIEVFKTWKKKEKYLINKDKIEKIEDDIFIVKYKKTNKGYFFLFSNKNIQVSYFDGTKILFNYFPKGIAYISNDKNNTITIFPLNENVSFYPSFKENSKLLMYLYLDDLDKITNYSQRYSNINNLCSIDESAKYDNIQEAVNVYVKILENVRNNFVSDEFKNAFDDLKNNVNNVYFLISDLLNISLNVINTLSSSIIDYIGKYGKIWDLLNCNFVGINIKIILNQLHFGVGKNLIKIGIIFICLSFIQILNIIIILITTRIYKQNIKKNKIKNLKEKKEKDSYINNSNDSIEIKKE